MDGRHDLSLFPAMDNTGHPNSPQLRPTSYGDLCRPPGTPTDPTSTLSAAYHSRYLAPLPMSTGSTFPFLSGMFPGTTFPTTPANTSFRAPSAPGITSMRQFWPPTPPPDGYGRYGMSTSLFPLFGSVSPTLDSGTYMTQGLVSRLGTTTHFPHLIDGHKDPGFFSPGFRLASPLTPSSHVSPTAPFSHILPSLDKHPTFGTMPLPSKHLDDGSGEAQKIHAEKYAVNGRSKSDKLHEKFDLRKTSLHYASKTEDLKPIRKVDAKLNLPSPHKISPCEIDVHCSPSIKPDILSPPLDSPKFDVAPSPKPISRKQTYSPLQLTSPPVSSSSFTAYKGKMDSQCSTCCPNTKGVGIATKLRGHSKKVSATFHPPPTVPERDAMMLVDNKSSNSMNGNSEAKVSSPVVVQATSPDVCENTKVVDATHGSRSEPKYSTRPQEPENLVSSHVFQEQNATNCKMEPNASRSNYSISSKHVTAAVIPTAPKQMVQRDFNNHLNSSSTVLEMKHHPFKNSGMQSHSEASKPQNLQKIKSESADAVPGSVNPENVSTSPVTNECKLPFNKNNSSCKVKDMIKAAEPQKPTSIKSPQSTCSQRFEESTTEKSPPKDATVPLVVSSCATQSTFASDDTDNNDSSDSSGQTSQAASQASMANANSSFDCKSQNSNSWTKAAVTPYNWQKNCTNGDDHQAINLTVSKTNATSRTIQDTASHHEEASVGINTMSSSETVKITLENVSVTNTGVIGVCHPNSSKVSSTSCPNRFSTFQSVSQPDVSTEVLVSSKSSLLQVPRHSATPPGTIKGSMVNTSFQSRTLMKLERLNTTKRGKSDVEKVLPTSRGNLAALAPKLTKKVGFMKDGKTSHTLSTSSSVSSTSIVFPASAVNSCIPVGIAIAQQRQDTSTATTVGKTQTTAQSTVSEIVATTTHSNQVATEIASQDVLRDQKPQEIISTTSCSSDPSNFLVTPGSTILSRQWESEAVTRATLPSPWVTHAPIVAPAVWIGNGAYATTTAPPTATAIPPAVNPVDTSPISLPPGGYQLARDSITGHLFLIPSANIGNFIHNTFDRTPIWPSYNASTSNALPIQHLVSQQHHTQFEQVVPQGTEAESVQDCVALSVQQTHASETSKELSVPSSCLPSADNPLQTSLSYKPSEQHGKIEIKRESATNSVPPVPLASGQTFTFTTFPANCDPSSFSYVLQSSTVMHLAHTTSSIQTESGKRSQGTSPLHCASPSPPPSSSVQVAEETVEEESDNDVDEVARSEATHVKLSPPTQSVTAAIQVDMDAQTTSEDDDESEARGVAPTNVEMSDSANQTENVKCDSENESMDHVAINMTVPNETSNDKVNSDLNAVCTTEEPTTSSLEIITSEMELAPLLPVESQPVMDFIDHHGLNLLVDSIEEFASREKEAEQRPPVSITNSDDERQHCIKLENSPISSVSNPVSITQSYGALDATCTDGLGLLCALAEQRFLEESLNNDYKKDEVTKEMPGTPNSTADNNAEHTDFSEHDQSDNSDFKFNDPFDMTLHPTKLRACELEMRKQLADLQRKYKEKELELARLKTISDTEGECKRNHLKKSVAALKRKNMPFVMPKLKSKNCVPSIKKTSPPESSLSKPSQLLKKSLLQRKRIKKLGRPSKKLNLYLKKHSKQASNDSENESVSTSDKVPDDDIESTIFRKCSKSIASKKRVQSNIRANYARRPQKLKSSLQIRVAKSVKKRNTKILKAASQLKSSKEQKTNSSGTMTSENTQTPFFDEQAWCIRRSERIFLNEARFPIVSTFTNSSSCTITKKASISNGILSTKQDSIPKDKKEKNKAHQRTGEASKSSGLTENDFPTKKAKQAGDGNLSRKRQLSLSSSGSDSSDSESCEESSSQSDNVPLSCLLDQAPSSSSKGSTCNEKISVDSDSSDSSFAPSEDIPLSILLAQNSVKAETRSCILTTAELQDKTRVLILDEGLFYAGHINAIQAPDVYGITLDGERAHRPHIFSREEILNAAVLEIKPTQKAELPEGSRVCAYWSQQYRCLYPGRVTKSSSPLPDPSLLFVEFDDGDSGRIPIDDIRMLPPDFPIVSMEPNPLLILGKRRARCDKENMGDSKNPTGSVAQKGNNKTETKCPSKIKKRRLDSIDDKEEPEDTFYKKESKSESYPENLSCLKTSIISHSSKSSEKKKRNTSDIRTHDSSESSGTDIGHSTAVKPKKHKKHKVEHKHHHKHHHHHHRHHHHRKHKTSKQSLQAEYIENTVISVKPVVQNSHVDSSVPSLSPVYAECHTLCTEKTSELTMKIKTSPPHVAHDCEFTKKIKIDGASSSYRNNEKADVKGKKSKSKKSIEDKKPAKRKDRMPSVEKSKIAAFLPVRQLWRWSGKGHRRPGSRGKAKKEFYRAIQRGKELLSVGDCAVFLSTGRPHLPYIGRIESMWESWGGKMDVKVKWFYHPEETKSSKKLTQLNPGALFQSPHFDENDVQTISHKCEVLSWEEYQEKMEQSADGSSCYSSLFDNNDIYYLAGTYDPITGSLIMEPDIPKLPALISHEN